MRKEKSGIEKKALVIAVSDYQNQALRNLDFCRRDGIDISRVLGSQRYQIYGSKKLIGEVKFYEMRESVSRFFLDKDIGGDDTLLFYYSGHGVQDSQGDIYLASSEIDPDLPYSSGFSFHDYTKMIETTQSSKVVCILDCCYSGAAKTSKSENDSAKKGNIAIQKKTDSVQQGKAKCILAASQATQEAYAKQKGDHSVFTYYLIEGLKKNKGSVDENGNVTADSLAKYVYRTITRLPPKERPKQEPIRKVEAGDDIILARYPRLAKRKLSWRKVPKMPLNKERDAYFSTLQRRFSGDDYDKTFRMAANWRTKFAGKKVIPQEEINSFDNEFVKGKMNLLIISFGPYDAFSRVYSNIMDNDLIPQIYRLEELYRGDHARINPETKKRIMKMQKEIAKTLHKIIYKQPP